MPEFDVYEKVWIIQNNIPMQLVVFAVVQSMNFSKNGTETYYHLVNDQCGAGWGNNEGIKRTGKYMFPTKETLLGSL